MPPGQFLIVQNQVPATGGGCAIPASVTNSFRGSGDLDVRLVFDGAEFGYVAFPVMQNNLPPSDEGADLNRIAVSSFDVDVSVPEDPTDPEHLKPNLMRDLFANLDAAGPSPLLHYNIPFVASVASGGGNTSAGLNAFPAELARTIRSMGALGTAAYSYVTTTIHVRGRTDGGRDVKSDAFAYPIRVCDGCLIASETTCPAAVEPANPGNPCNVAQDQVVDCCRQGTGLICPSRVAAQ